jgi:D-alanyl-D-alanine carboxypeptidase/D-alanyl-D-alanine-endopeptidase (penicillin-binding protein 4)
MTDGGRAGARADGRTSGRAVGHGRRTAVAALAALAALAAPLAAQTGSLAKRLDARLDAPPFHRMLWGVAVVDDKGKLLYGRNADRLFVPASNTKLVVSAAAAALLPPDLRMRTSVYAAGPIVDGIVQGDLVLYGRGDPTMSRRCYAVDTLAAGACDLDASARLDALADTLAARGIRAVSGDVVGDGSWFDAELLHPSWEWYDLNWWYAAPVSGLGFNDNSIDITLAPGPREGTPAQVAFAPDFGDVTLENRTRTVGDADEETIDWYREPGTLRIWGEGTVQADARPRTEHFALPDPNRFAAQALRAALARRGIAVHGAAASTLDSMRYEFVRRGPAVAETPGRPVRDWIFPILNTSQNWFAEMVLKQLGRRFGAAGSWSEGLKVERRFLIDSVGIDSTQFALVDGSGLAANNLVSPLAFTQLLRYMQSHPNAGTFVAGMPVAGQAGSLRTRFRGTPVEGKVIAKTGTISRTSTLSGYVETPKGRRLTFSIQANHHALSTAAVRAQLDSLVVEMTRGL